MSPSVSVSPIENDVDRAWARQLIVAQWGSLVMVARGVLTYMADLPGFVATHNGERAGLLTYQIAGDECEVMSLDSLKEGIGVGSALLTAVQDTARAAGCKRLWLITTNDNVHALRFYQRRGFCLVALYPNAVAASRRLKPQIPLIGLNDIPLRDEIELELML